MTPVAEHHRAQAQIDLYDPLETLETLPGLRATRREWEIRCGGGFAFVEPLLQPVGGVADCMPCIGSNLGLHYHDIVELSNGTVLAVCSDEYYDCPSFSVERWERAVLSPDMGMLALRICGALGLDLRVQERPGGIAIDSHPIYEIGCYHPLESYEFPAVVSFHPGTAGTEESLLICVAAFDGPFIFLTATPKCAFRRVGPVINGRSILVSSLSECLAMSGDLALSATDHWHRHLDHFREKTVPRSEPVLAFFKTPANTRWESVSIRFIDGYTAFVDAAGVRGRFNYTEMGMSNRKNSNPSKQWLFLREIAENHGAIDFEMGDPRKNESWKNELAHDLRTFFRIADNPFLYDKSTGCWQARFRVLPE